MNTQESLEDKSSPILCATLCLWELELSARFTVKGKTFDDLVVGSGTGLADVGVIVLLKEISDDIIHRSPRI